MCSVTFIFPFPRKQTTTLISLCFTSCYDVQQLFYINENLLTSYFHLIKICLLEVVLESKLNSIPVFLILVLSTTYVLHAALGRSGRGAVGPQSSSRGKLSAKVLRERQLYRYQGRGGGIPRHR